MEKHVRDQLVQSVAGLYRLNWQSDRIKELLLQKGVAPNLVDQIDEAGYQEFRRRKRNANAHIASGIFLFVVGILITWGAYSATSGGMIVVFLGVIFFGIAEFIKGLTMRKELKTPVN